MNDGLDFAPVGVVRDVEHDPTVLPDVLGGGEAIVCLDTANRMDGVELGRDGHTPVLEARAAEDLLLNDHVRRSPFHDFPRIWEREVDSTGAFENRFGLHAVTMLAKPLFISGEKIDTFVVVLRRLYFGILGVVWGLPALSCKSAPADTPPSPIEAGAASTKPSPPQPSAPSSSASAPSPSASATASAPVSDGSDAGVVPDVPDDPKLSFYDNRLQRAKAGTTELVSLRVWHCGPSCTCPPPCLESVTEEYGSKWLDLVDAAGKPVAIPDWTNADVVGKFTGRTRKAKGPSPEEHTLLEFRTIGAPAMVNKAMAPEFEGVKAKVLLRGPLAEKVVPKVKDDRPYLVVVGSFPLSNADHEEAAAKFLKRVQDAGFPDAERVDSRAFSSLTCCFELVIAGRFPDVPSAESRRAALTAKRFHPYVKKGF